MEGYCKHERCQGNDFGKCKSNCVKYYAELETTTNAKLQTLQKEYANMEKFYQDVCVEQCKEHFAVIKAQVDRAERAEAQLLAMREVLKQLPDIVLSYWVALEDAVSPYIRSKVIDRLCNVCGKALEGGES